MGSSPTYRLPSRGGTWHFRYWIFWYCLNFSKMISCRRLRELRSSMRSLQNWNRTMSRRSRPREASPWPRMILRRPTNFCCWSFHSSMSVGLTTSSLVYRYSTRFELRNPGWRYFQYYYTQALVRSQVDYYGCSTRLHSKIGTSSDMWTANDFNSNLDKKLAEIRALSIVGS